MGSSFLQPIAQAPLQNEHRDDHEVMLMEGDSTSTTRSMRYRPFAFGLLAALGLAAVFLGVVTVAESWAHALEVFRQDALFVVPIILGFGVQVGLLTYLKLGMFLPASTRGTGAYTGVSGGASAVAMAACCAHHVTDVLPLVGLAGASVFLAQYKVPFMIVGLLSNVVGIGILLNMIRKARQHAVSECA